MRGTITMHRRHETRAFYSEETTCKIMRKMKRQHNTSNVRITLPLQRVRVTIVAVEMQQYLLSVLLTYMYPRLNSTRISVITVFPHVQLAISPTIPVQNWQQKVLPWRYGRPESDGTALISIQCPD